MPSPAVERELRASGDTQLLRQAQRAERPKAGPKPALAEILELYEYLREYYREWREEALEERKRRYLKDKLPARIQKEQFDGRRFFSRLTHNEINRVVGQQTDNPPRFIIPAAGDSPAEKEAGIKQTRWANNLLEALERGTKGRRGMNIRRRLADLQNEIGFCGLEVYLTSAYDDLDGELSPDETPASNLKRLEESTRQRRMPFGVRIIDGLNLLLDEGDDDVQAALIVEDKPIASQTRRYPHLKGKVGKAPMPGAAGYPSDQGAVAPSGVTTVQTIRYYDAYWYAYIVDGVFAVEPKPHGLPGIPVFPLYGMVTGSPNLEEGIEGICWGMGSAELAINDMMTLMMDVTWKNRHPKFVVETELQGRFLPDPNNPNAPMALDLSDIDTVQQLLPGQKLVNGYKDWEPYFQMPMLELALSIWGRSAQNPIAQGQSPGADPAGYTVATLTDNAGTVYKDNIANEAKLWGQVVDFVRRMVRETIKLPVPLTASAGRGKVGVEWLALTPEDVSDVPAIVTIDPNSDAHRLANRQSWMEGNERGYVPRREVQVRAFGAEDPEEWDDEIVLDGMRERIAQMAVEGAMTEVGMLQMPPPGAQGGGLVDQNGNPMPPSGGAGPSGPPIPQGPPSPQPPTVGGAAQGASTAFTGSARAGQDNGYVPASRRM